jgi:hypothetical protein
MGPIEDVIAIEQLAARYNHAIDSLDAEGWAATFAEGGSFQSAGRDAVVGREALEAFVRGRDATTRHYNSNLLIEVDGDTATMRAYLELVRHREIVATGHYEDTLRRVDGEWRFVSRLVTPDPRPEAPQER